MFPREKSNQQTNPEKLSMAYTDRKEIVIPAHKVNKQALRMVGPLIILYILFYGLLWPDKMSLEAFRSAMPDNPLVVVAIVTGGIVAHEALHGLTWALFCRGGFRSIRFGFMTRLLAPYCHCTVPLKLIWYITGGLMPGVLMGILPAAIALATGQMGWMLTGIFFTFAAGGDFAMMWLLRKLPSKSLVRDHPSELGCFVYEPSE